MKALELEETVNFISALKIWSEHLNLENFHEPVTDS